MPCPYYQRDSDDMTSAHGSSSTDAPADSNKLNSSSTGSVEKRISDPKNQERLSKDEIDQIYLERMEEEYAKREGGC